MFKQNFLSSVVRFTRRRVITMHLRFMASLSLVLVLFFPMNIVYAVPITVKNSSFEEDTLLCDGGPGCYSLGTIQDWVSDEFYTIGPFKPSVGPDQEFISIPDGVNVAAIGNSGGGGKIFQALTDVVVPNTLYTLQVSVGHRADYPFSQYTISLEAGGMVLTSSSSLSPALGMFATDTLIFSSGLTPSAWGQQLGIRLAATGRTATGAAAQADFDLVLLDASPQSSTVPEPASLALLGIGLAGLGFMRRRRTDRRDC